ncbi:MAG TPA: homoserine dehydrogenase, partial [Gaiellaceae bacterium]|nr:homoserine dehydrogenase [Gaiellaceae bacterium]
IPVIKVLRESLVVTNVHRVLGIVNGTTNFLLTEMENGATYAAALADAQARGYAEADPADDVSGADAAAKMAILAAVAFKSRVSLDDVEYRGIEDVDPLDVAAARELDMVIRLVGVARLTDGHVDVRVEPAFVDRRHPLAKIDGAFNAVMLQGDAIREITLEGPGAGGIETASAVIADMVSVIGTMGTGFLQNDAAWRELPLLPAGESRSPFYFRLSIEDRPGALARVAEELAEHDISVARLLQHANGNGAALHVITHEARSGALADALDAVADLHEVHGRPRSLPVISQRGVVELAHVPSEQTGALVA